MSTESSQTFARVMSYIDHITQEIIKLRRDLHQYPELSHHETKTCKTLESFLIAHGISSFQKFGSTSIGVLFSAGSAPAIAFRADIDALPITEINSCEFRSKNQGVMHACGHDVHTSIVMGLALVCNEIKDLLHRPVRIIFQQAEEVFPSGAPMLISDGVLSNPVVDEIYGIHVWPDLPINTIGIRRGSLMGSVEGIKISISSLDVPDSHDRGGGLDAIRAASELITDLRSIMHGRKLTDSIPASLMFGKINGGEYPGRFPRQVVLEGSIRSLTPIASQVIHQEVDKICSSLADRKRLQIDIKYTPNIRPFVINDEQCIDVVEKASAMIEAQLSNFAEPLHCSEDFGFYLENVKGAFIKLGSSSGEATSRQLHSPDFQVDERVIPIGMKLLSTILLERSFGIPQY